MLPAARLTDTGRCGSCKEVLPPSSEPIEADELTFDEIIRSIPNFIVFRDGVPVLQRAGTAPRAEIRNWLESVEAAAAPAA